MVGSHCSITRARTPWTAPQALDTPPVPYQRCLWPFSTIILAAGSGVAGFLPVVRQITADSAPVTMIWSIRSIAGAPYVDELFAIAQPMFKLILTVSRPDLEAILNPPLLRRLSHGRLDHHSMKAAVKHSGPGSVVHVCVMDDYLKSAGKLARQAGITRWKVNLIK